MRSLLTAIYDESLLNRIKPILNDKTIQYHFAADSSDASDIAALNEIAVAIVDFESPIISGSELCELLLSYNPETQFILFFDEKYTKDVLDLYNSIHINKLMCKQHLVLEDLPMLIDSCLYTYNREEELDKKDDELIKMNDMYLKPMNEMSSILNERLIGYGYIIKVFRKSFEFVLDSTDKALECIDTFVDKIINDYIQIFMVNEPSVPAYFARIHKTFNDPDNRKYFKFICDEEVVKDELKYNLLFVLDVITICFDVFYPFYRGKVSVTNVEDGLEINAIYEVRKDHEIDEVYDYLLKAVSNIIKQYSAGVKCGSKDSIIQYKIKIA